MAGIGTATGEVQILVDQAIGNLQRLKREIGNVDGGAGGGGALAATDDRLQKIDAGLQVAGASALVMGTAITGGFAVGLNSAMNFEAQMSAVGSVAGASKEELALLREEALRLGADTSMSASEAAAAMEIMLKAGASLTDVLDGAAQAAINLSEATGAPIELSAETAAAAMNIFGVSAEEAANLISQSANASALDVNDWALALKTAGPVASSLGLDMSDLAEAMVILGDSGIKGEVGATALRNILIGLSDPVGEAATELQKWGVATHDAQGNMRQLKDITADLAGSWDTMTQSQKTSTAETIAGKDGMAAFMAMMDAQTASVKDGSNAFDDAATRMGDVGSVSEQAAARMDNLKGAFEQLKGTLETIAITFFSRLTPAVQAVVGVLQTLAGFLLSLPGPIQLLIAAGMGLVGAFLLIGGTALLIAPQIMTAVRAIQALRTAGSIGGAFQLMTKAMTGATAANTANAASATTAATANRTLAASVRMVLRSMLPMAAVIGAGILAWKAYEHNVLGFRTLVDGARRVITDFGGAAVIGIAMAATQMGRLTGVIGSLMPPVTRFGVLLENTGLAITRLAGTLSGRFGAIGGVMVNTFDRVGTAMTNASTRFLQFGRISDRLSGVGAVLGRLFAPVARLVGGMQSLAGTAAKALPIIGRFSPIIARFLGPVGIAITLFDIWRHNFLGIRDAVMGVIGVFADFGRYIKAVVTTGDELNDWLTHLPGFLQPIAEAIGKVLAPFGSFIEAFKGFGGTKTVTVDTQVTGDDKVLERITNPDAPDGFDYMVRIKNPDGSLGAFGQVIESYTDENDPNIAHIKVKTDEGEYWTTINNTTGEIGDGTITVKAEASAAESTFDRINAGLDAFQKTADRLDLGFLSTAAGWVQTLVGWIEEGVESIKEFGKGFAKAWKVLDGNPLAKLFKSISAGLKFINGDDTPQWLVKLAGFFDRVGDAVQKVSDIFQGFRRQGMDPLAAAFRTAGAIIPPLAGYFSRVEATARAVWETIKNLLGVVGNLLQAFGNLITGDVDGALRNVGEAFGKLKDAAGSAWDVLKNGFMQIPELLKGVFEAIDWGGVLDGLLDLAGKIPGALQAVSDAVLGWIQRAADAIPWSDLVSGAAGLAADAIGFMGDLAADVLEWISGAIPTAEEWKKLVSTAGDIITGLSGKLGDLAGWVARWIGDAVPGAETWRGLLDNASDIVSGLSSRLGDLAAWAVRWITDAAPGLDTWRGLLSKAGNIVTGLSRYLGDLGAWVLRWISDAAPTVTEIVDGLFGLIEFSAESLSGLASGLVDAIKGAIETAWSGLKSWASGLWSDLTGWLFGGGDTTADLGSPQVAATVNTAATTAQFDATPMAQNIVTALGNALSGGNLDVSSIRSGLNAMFAKAVQGGGTDPIGGLKGSAHAVGEGFIYALRDYFTGTTDGSTIAEGIENAFWKAATAMAEGIKDDAKAVGETFLLAVREYLVGGTSGATLGEGMAGAFGKAATHEYTTPAHAVGEAFATAVAEYFSGTADGSGLAGGMDAWITKAVALVAPRFKDEATTAGEGASEGAAQGVFNRLSIVKTAVESWTTQARNEEPKWKRAATTAGEGASAGAAQGIFNRLSIVKTAVESWTRQVTNENAAMGRAGTTLGETGGTNTAQGMLNRLSTMSTAVGTFTTTLRNSGNGMRDSGIYAGSMGGAGVAQGLLNMLPAVESASAAIIEVVDRTMRRVGEIRSPSRMTRYIGRMLMQGLLVQLWDGVRTARDAARDVMQAVRDGLTPDGDVGAPLVEALEGVTGGFSVTATAQRAPVEPGRRLIDQVIAAYRRADRPETRMQVVAPTGLEAAMRSVAAAIPATAFQNQGSARPINLTQEITINDASDPKKVADTVVGMMQSVAMQTQAGNVLRLGTTLGPLG